MIELELVVLLKMGNFIFSCLENVSLSMHAWPLMSGTTHLCHHESCCEDINFFVSHLTSPTLVTSEGQHIEVEYLHFFFNFPWHCISKLENVITLKTVNRVHM